jgi:putative adhesin
MRGEVRQAFAVLPLAMALLAHAAALPRWPAAADPVLRARRLVAGAPVKMFIPSGTVELVGWDHDSIEIRGTVPRAGALVLSGSDTAGLKLMIEPRNRDASIMSRVIVHLPRRSQVSIKTVDAIVRATDVGGWFYTVSGRIRLDGSATSVDAEAMSGDLDLNVSTPWARAKTGKGHLAIGGSPEDVDASTISGALDVSSPTIMRGRFTSVAGDIRYASTMLPKSLFEFSNHSGSVELTLPRDVSARLELSSVEGEIDDGYHELHPATGGTHNLQLLLGTGASDVTVRTFRGTVRLRMQNR